MTALVKIVTDDWTKLEFIPNPPYKVCLAAVRSSGQALRFVDITNKTYEICITAVQMDAFAIGYVPWIHRTHKLCKLAVGQNGLMLQYVPNSHLNDHLIMRAVKQNGEALEFVKYQTPEVCLAAIMSNPSAIRFIKHLTYEQCFKAVEKDPNVLYYVPESFQTRDLCLAAMRKKNGSALMYCFRPTLEICCEAIKHLTTDQVVNLIKTTFLDEKIKSILLLIKRSNMTPIFIDPNCMIDENYKEKLNLLV